jgi:hypothetical protein
MSWLCIVHWKRGILHAGTLSWWFAEKRSLCHAGQVADKDGRLTVLQRAIRICVFDVTVHASESEARRRKSARATLIN